MTMFRRGLATLAITGVYLTPMSLAHAAPTATPAPTSTASSTPAAAKTSMVPSVIGATRPDAVKSIRDAGLSADVTVVESAVAAPGTVLSQSPDAGAERKPGSTVSVTVAAAPAPTKPSTSASKAPSASPSAAPTTAPAAAPSRRAQARTAAAPSAEPTATVTPSAEPTATPSRPAVSAEATSASATPSAAPSSDATSSPSATPSPSTTATRPRPAASAEATSAPQPSASATPSAEPTASATGSPTRPPATPNADPAISAPSAARPGDTITVNVSVFDPSAPVTIALDSVTLASVTTNGFGAASAQVTIPADTAPGSHIITATSATMTRTAAIDVASSLSPRLDPLAATNAGGAMAVSGSGFAPNTEVDLSMSGPGGVFALGKATTDSVGAFNTSVLVTDTVPSGPYSVLATSTGAQASAPVDITASRVDARIGVDHSIYLPGSTVTVAGTGFRPGESVTFDFRRGDAVIATTTVAALGDGSVSTTFVVPSDVTNERLVINAGAPSLRGNHVSAAVPTPSNQAALSALSPVPAGGNVSTRGMGFTPGAPVVFTFVDSKGIERQIGATTASADGSFIAPVTVPADTNIGPGSLTAADSAGRRASTTVDVTKANKPVLQPILNQTTCTIGASCTIVGSNFAPSTLVTVDLSSMGLSHAVVESTNAGTLVLGVSATDVFLKVRPGTYPITATANGVTVSSTVTVVDASRPRVTVTPRIDPAVGGRVSGSGFVPNRPVTVTFTNANGVVVTYGGDGLLWADQGGSWSLTDVLRGQGSGEWIIVTSQENGYGGAAAQTYVMEPTPSSGGTNPGTGGSGSTTNPGTGGGNGNGGSTPSNPGTGGGKTPTDTTGTPGGGTSTAPGTVTTPDKSSTPPVTSTPGGSATQPTPVSPGAGSGLLPTTPVNDTPVPGEGSGVRSVFPVVDNSGAEPVATTPNSAAAPVPSSSSPQSSAQAPDFGASSTLSMGGNSTATSTPNEVAGESAQTRTLPQQPGYDPSTPGDPSRSETGDPTVVPSSRPSGQGDPTVPKTPGTSRQPGTSASATPTPVAAPQGQGQTSNSMVAALLTVAGLTTLGAAAAWWLVVGRRRLDGAADGGLADELMGETPDEDE